MIFELNSVFSGTTNVALSSSFQCLEPHQSICNLQNILEELGLRTEPDLSEVWIGHTISIELASDFIADRDPVASGPAVYWNGRRCGRAGVT